MCGVCQQVKSPDFSASMFAAGLSGLAVGVKLSWRQVVDRIPRGRRDESAEAAAESSRSSAG